MPYKQSVEAIFNVERPLHESEKPFVQMPIILARGIDFLGLHN